MKTESIAPSRPRAARVFAPVRQPSGYWLVLDKCGNPFQRILFYYSSLQVAQSVADALNRQS